MGDDIGWMQPHIYHRGLMVGETPNIDRIGNEGGIFMTYYAEQSCTAGRNAFFTGMHPLRTGMIPPQLPGSPSYLRPGTPALAVFLRDLGYTTGEFGKNHLGDHTDALPTAHGFQEFWGYLYHLDAMLLVYNRELHDETLYSTRDRVWHDPEALKAVINTGKPMIFFHNHPAEDGRAAMFPSSDDFGVAGLLSFMVYAANPSLAVEFRVMQFAKETGVVSYGFKRRRLKKSRKSLQGTEMRLLSMPILRQLH